MKNILKISLFVFSMFSLAGCVTSQSVSDGSGGTAITFDDFYQTLSPYGRWVNYPQYGEVWIPNAGAGFQPYATNGHWVYTDYGWTWVSDYAWGWAPFHYGRWALDNQYGWIWVPGDTWAPAWVAWGNSPDYYGWAPLGPGMNTGISIMDIPASRWVFVPHRYITSSNVYQYYQPAQQNITIIKHTTIINNVVERNPRPYSTGPTRQAVQQATNQTVQPVRVFNSSKPGQSQLENKDRLSIYRPSVKSSSGSQQVRPAGNNNTRPEKTPAANAPENKPTRVMEKTPT